MTHDPTASALQARIETLERENAEWRAAGREMREAQKRLQTTPWLREHDLPADSRKMWQAEKRFDAMLAMSTPSTDAAGRVDETEEP